MRIESIVGPMSEAQEATALQERAREFEALLLAKVMETMTETDESESASGGLQLQWLMWVEMARQLSEARQLGLAEQVQRELSTQAGMDRDATTGPAVAPLEGSQEAGADPLKWLLPVRGVLTSRYGYRTDPFDGSRRMHRGIDLAAPDGSPVVASAKGKVILSSFEPGYGHTVIVEHDGGLTTRYAHLASRLVSEGDWVNRGQMVGRVGSTGRATGPHLHYEIRRRGEAIDPQEFV